MLKVTKACGEEAKAIMVEIMKKQTKKTIIFSASSLKFPPTIVTSDIHLYYM